jgi:hypothetical protein
MAPFPIDRLPAELKEAVFVKLPSHDLLVQLPRVCRAWKTFIETSTALQQKLFFQAEPRRATPIFNPMLEELHPHLFWDFAGYGFEHNPFVLHENGIDPDDFVEVPRAPWIGTNRQHAVLRPNASWRRMFPTQPPTKLDGILIHEYWDCPGIARKIPGKLNPKYEDGTQGDGIRMGPLYDIAIHEMDRCYSPASEYWLITPMLRWNMFPNMFPREKPEKKGSDEQPDDGELGLKNTVTLEMDNRVFCHQDDLVRLPEPSGLAILYLFGDVFEYDDPVYAGYGMPKGRIHSHYPTGLLVHWDTVGPV